MVADGRTSETVNATLRNASMIALLAAFAWQLLHASGTVAVAALMPAVAYASLVTAAMGRRDRDVATPAASFLLGAVLAAAVASTLNTVAEAWLATMLRAADARALVAAVAVPVNEELAKAAALAAVVTLSPHAVRSVRDGITTGALVGLGFAVTENVLYLTMAGLQGGYAGLVRSVYLRGVIYGATHAVFTASTGAAVGWVRSEPMRGGRDVAAVAAGLAAAVVQHVLWNTAAATIIQRMLCGAPAAAACLPAPPAVALYVGVPLVAALALAPGVVALLAVARRTARDDRQRTFGITSRS